MRWHDILRVINDYRVRAVRVNSTRRRCAYVPNGTLGGGPERNAHAPSLPIDRTTTTVFVKLYSHESSRTDTSDRDWFPDQYPSSFLTYYFVIPRREDIILAFRRAQRPTSNSSGY